MPRAARSGLTILLALAITGCTAGGNTAVPVPEILEISQGVFTAGDFPLQVERRDEVRVLALRRQEKLDEVVSGAKGELDLFKKLTAWARSQFEPGIPDPYPLCNGLSILADIRSGKTGGFCGQYSYLLADALKSFGFFAVRYVELEREAGAGHFAVEAWCDDLGRWVLLDPLHAALYDRDGVPLSAIELHEELLAGRAGSIKINRLPLMARPASGAAHGGPGPGPSASTPPEADEELLSVFYNVAISTRNDFAHLEEPLTLAERETLFLRYADPRVTPFRHLNFALSSVRKGDFLAPMNQVAIDATPEPGKATLHLAFSTRGTCPHFVCYRVRIGGGPWKDSGALIAWGLAGGDNLLEVRAVNAFEVLGPIFSIRARA